MTHQHDPRDAFTRLTSAGSRLGFFMLNNYEAIPTAPGCYGWFLPLWIRYGHESDPLPEFIRTYGQVVGHAPDPSPVEADFAWDALEMRLHRKFKWSHALPHSVPSTWHRLNKANATRSALQQILLQASILTPPLYVGMTTNLRRRYRDHTTGSRSGFRTRFLDYCNQNGLGLNVHDLLYVCVTTDSDLDNVLDTAKNDAPIHSLVEEILKRLCTPPFSKR